MNRSDVWRRCHGDVKNKQKEKRLGKKFRFPLELNEKTNEVGLRLTLFVFFIFNKKTAFLKRQYCSTDLSKISHKFTDKGSIFINVSVNDGDFAKCSACSIIMLSHQANLPPNYFRIFPSCQLLVTHTQNPGLDLRLIANHPGVQFETDFFQDSF